MAGAAVQNVGMVESTRMTRAGRATTPRPDAEQAEGFGQALEDARQREVKVEERPVKATEKKERGQRVGSSKEEPRAEIEAAGVAEATEQGGDAGR